jgi:hypothetical protein
MELTSNTMLVLLLIFVVIFLLSGQKNEKFLGQGMPPMPSMTSMIELPDLPWLHPGIGLTIDRIPGAVKCSDEGGHCNVSSLSPRTIYYGAGDKWATTKSSSPGRQCNVQTFGYDPVPFVQKSCYVR